MPALPRASPPATRITPELLAATERAEGWLFSQGYTDFRVRLLDGCARLQFPADQLSRALAQHDEIVAALKPDYRAVLLDLEARHA